MSETVGQCPICGGSNFTGHVCDDLLTHARESAAFRWAVPLFAQNRIWIQQHLSGPCCVCVIGEPNPLHYHGDTFLEAIEAAMKGEHPRPKMPQVVEITINKVQVGVRHDADTDVFVGFCPRFNVYSQGESRTEAIDAVASAVVLRIAAALEHGRLENILKLAGLDRISGSELDLTPDDEFVFLTVKTGKS